MYDRRKNRTLPTGAKKLAGLGYVQYTIHDFTKPGSENRYRLEQLKGTEQLGIGYKAESRIEGVTYKNGHSLQQYLDHSDDLSVLVNQLARLDEESELYREIRAALFTMQGIDLTEIQQKYGLELEQKAAEMIRQMEAEGNICFRDEKWVLTDAGAVNFL